LVRGRKRSQVEEGRREGRGRRRLGVDKLEVLHFKDGGAIRRRR
jgi:hypothetical protein